MAHHNQAVTGGWKWNHSLIWQWCFCMNPSPLTSGALVFTALTLHPHLKLKCGPTNPMDFVVRWGTCSQYLSSSANNLQGHAKAPWEISLVIATLFLSGLGVPQIISLSRKLQNMHDTFLESAGKDVQNPTQKSHQTSWGLPSILYKAKFEVYLTRAHAKRMMI